MRPYVRRLYVALTDVSPYAVTLPRLGFGTDEDDEPCLDADQLQVRVGGRQMQLSRLEFGVAQTLIARQGRAVSRRDLIEQGWGTTYLGGNNVVDAVVRTLRSKLGDDAAMIETIRGVGYRYKWT